MAKEKKHIVKIQRMSKYSYSITLPKEIVKNYGWRERQKLTVEDKGRGNLKIKDWKRK